jgi:hypothetical protein
MFNPPVNRENNYSKATYNDVSAKQDTIYGPQNSNLEIHIVLTTKPTGIAQGKATLHILLKLFSYYGDL